MGNTILIVPIHVKQIFYDTSWFMRWDVRQCKFTSCMDLYPRKDRRKQLLLGLIAVPASFLFRTYIPRKEFIPSKRIFIDISASVVSLVIYKPSMS